MSTEEKQAVWEKQCFGCTIDHLEQFTLFNTDALMVAMSILSDAQELLLVGKLETARQYINRAKYFIGKHRTADRTPD